MVGKGRGTGHRSLRVQSWIYEAINVLLEALGRELVFLSRANLSWRFYNRQTEYLHSLESYVSPSSRPIFHDFLRANAGSQSALEGHDDLLKQATRHACAAHDALVANNVFIRSAQDRLRDYMQTPNARPPGGAFPPEQFPNLVAERVVNHIEEVPSHYTDSEFWRMYSREFLPFGQGPTFMELALAVEALHTRDVQITSWLDDKRLELCERYDLPAAPFPGMGSE
ncbi:MAG TPA: hypothetical protein VHE35_15730 [Kofleriaceae bacterium]|nr:hypothetical protein [Kofleriaceae bacterium]